VHFDPAEMLHWTTFLKVGLPLLIGSLVIAVPAALISYVVAYQIMHRRSIRALKSRD